MEGAATIPGPSPISGGVHVATPVTTGYIGNHQFRAEESPHNIQYQGCAS